VKIGLVVLVLKWGRKWKLCRDLAAIWWSWFIRHASVSKRIGISQFRFQHVNR